MLNKIIFISSFVFVCSNLLSQTQIRKVRPSDTNPAITLFNTDSNYVYYNSSVASKNTLVVHLPGSYGEPKRATLFGKLASDLGFHSIGLMYPNVPTVGSFCTNSADEACFETVRREIVEGNDYSTSIDINAEESILGRTQKLLVYLNLNYPSENWGQFLDINGNILYNKVIFSGHSQGGGHAAILAKYYPIKRALCFSSPKDWRNKTNAPPLWLSSGNWQTPSSSIYAFNHILDEHTNQLVIWDSLGLNDIGLPINVDNVLSPYNYTRQLTTSYNVPSGDNHACTIQDNKTPKISGVPVFTPVWTYMLTDDRLANTSNNLKSIDSKLIVYPNPSQGILNIEIPDEFSIIYLFDQMGNCIYQVILDSTKNQIDIKNLAKGIYFLEVRSSSRTLTEKVIKL